MMKKLTIMLGIVLLLAIFVIGFFLNGLLSPKNHRKASPGMVYLPAGIFLMGSTAPDALNNEKPARNVHLDAFYLDETEVTNAQFRKFIEATGY
ncbi:MAG TPA: SUMF1/EgtB/PvdO family nonheme iron enzyme, partial [Gemmatales bacterium]|nr:SUMF1/EgtB/PvdO family nonheme iron enzyme [Gemmatales bacterium]